MAGTVPKGFRQVMPDAEFPDQPISVAPELPEPDEKPRRGRLF